MGCLENILWFIFGGFLLGMGWFVTGLLWCLTIVGIPVGVQCFKIGLIAMCPFGQNLDNDGKASSFILNILWIVFGGLELSVFSFVMGILCCITIIGIPFGKQFFKLAKIAMMPFGTSIH